MRVIVAAAGNQSRWGNYLGVPKHLVPIDGEPLLRRTVRQLTGHEVIVVGPDDARYRIPGSRLVTPSEDGGKWAGPLIYTQQLRDPDGRTLLLLGDTCFSDEGMATILGYEAREWRLFCRFDGSRLTGARWGEAWGHSFWPEHWERHDDRIRYIMDLCRRKVIRRNGLWEHYRAMAGAQGGAVGRHDRLGMATEIDDWTEDFDFPRDWNLWIALRTAALTRRV